MAEPVHRKLTYGDLGKIPPDRNRYELIDGKLGVSPAPLLVHQLVVKALYNLLERWIAARSCGLLLFAPVDVIFDPINVLEPDLLYVSRQRRERLTREGIRGAPDLVIEVLSESTARRDRIDKRGVYADFGVTEYWLADPENRSITVLVLERLSYRELLSATGDGIVLSRVLDGLSFPVSEVFADLGELGA